MQAVKPSLSFSDLPQVANARVADSSPPAMVQENGMNARTIPAIPVIRFPMDLVRSPTALGASLARSWKNPLQHGPPSAAAADFSRPTRALDAPSITGVIGLNRACSTRNPPV